MKHETEGRKEGEDTDDPIPIDVLRGIAGMVVALERDGSIHFVNEACSQKLGHSRDDLLEMRIDDLIKVDGLEKLKRHMREIREGGEPEDIEVVLEDANSDDRHFIFRPIPIEEHLKEKRIFFTITDVTAEKRLEYELSDTRNLLERIISTAEEGFVTLNKDGIVLRWSKGAERIFDLDERSIIGRYFHTLLKSTVQIRRLTDRLREITAGRTVTGMEFEGSRDDGTLVHLGITGAPILDRDGEVREVIFIIRDMTEKKHLEERLKESEKRLATEVIRKIEDLKYFEQLNRLVVQHMDEGALLLNTNLEIGYINPKIIDLIGYEENEIIGSSIHKVVPEDLIWAWELIPGESKKGSYRFESSFIKRNGEEVPVMVTAINIRTETRKSEFLCTVIDLTEQKEKEEKMREEMMDFKIKRGSVYMIVEKGFHKLVDVLMALHSLGHDIIIISRRSHRGGLKDFSQETNATLYWLEDKKQGTKSVRPVSNAIYELLDRRVRRSSVVVLDRLDYLLTRTSFEEIRDLLHDLVDLFYHKRAIMLLLADPSTIEDEVLKQLQKDAPVLEPKRPFIVPDELRAILFFVREQNKKGVEPSYKDVGKRFDISKTTTRKRIQKLLILELLEESKKGRSKRLKLSEKSSRIVPMKSSMIR